MTTKTLSLVAALAMIGCSSKFDDNARDPDGSSMTADDDQNADDENEEEEEDENDDEENQEPVETDDDGDGFSIEDGDCDDDDADINPDAEEICDGIDNNCNDRTDEAMRFDTYYVDADGDGFGDPDSEIEWCAEMDEYVSDNTDCDDTDANIYPGAEEIIGDSIDNDCDTNLDERFDTSTVSEDGDVGTASAIQSDIFGQLHLVYYDATAGDLLYTKRGVEGRWSEAEVVAEDENSGEFVDAVIDPTGTLHVAYTESDDYTRGLLYTQRSAAGTWSSPLVVDGFEPGEIDIGQYVSIDVDSWDRPSFGYFNADIGEPVVADTTILGMTVYISADNNYMGSVFPESHTGLYTSLAVDSAGNDHIAFYDPYASAGSDPQVQYSSFNLDLDELVYANTLDDAGQYISLAVRSDDVPCVAFQTIEGLNLKYGCYIDGDWDMQVIDDSGSTGAYASLAFNPSDEAYIAYYDQTHTRLMMAREVKDSGWELVEIDNDGNVGENAMLTVDESGIGHISYYDASSQTLKYAEGR